LSTLDAGWFAKKRPFAYRRPDPPEWAPGGDAFLESTPPVLTWYQARAGQIFTLTIGVERLRDYSVALQLRLVELLADHGIAARGGDADRGAFTIVSFESGADGAERCVEALAARGVASDARGPWLRLCPDLLTTAGELERAVRSLAEIVRA
jgi:kynureninase